VHSIRCDSSWQFECRLTTTIVIVIIIITITIITVSSSAATRIGSVFQEYSCDARIDVMSGSVQSRASRAVGCMDDGAHIIVDQNHFGEIRVATIIIIIVITLLFRQQMKGRGVVSAPARSSA